MRPFNFLIKISIIIISSTFRSASGSERKRTRGDTYGHISTGIPIVPGRAGLLCREQADN